MTPYSVETSSYCNPCQGHVYTILSKNLSIRLDMTAGYAFGPKNAEGLALTKVYKKY